MKKILSLFLAFLFAVGGLSVAYAEDSSAKLYGTYGDDMLFQQNKDAVFAGTASAGATITVEMYSTADELVASGSSTASADGTFTVSFLAPAGGYEEYKVILKENSVEFAQLDNVVFGELWLASGQSNMQYPLGQAKGGADMFKNSQKLSKWLRVLHMPFYCNNNESDTFADPQLDAADAVWTTGENGHVYNMSAVAYYFAVQMMEELDMPVGILNASLGGSAISSWLSRDAIDGDSKVKNYLVSIDKYIEKSDWEKIKPSIYQDMTSNYNHKIHPLRNFRPSGMIWYQGENECSAEYDNRIYADYLRLYHRAYKERFAADPDNFMTLSSLLYLWTYGISGECRYGYLNEAFIETAIEAPEKFAFMPIADLEPQWSYHTGNHPIHPVHKYTVGARMASLAIGNVYGGDHQKSPATLESYEITGNRMRLKFRNTGIGLRVSGKLHGMYIAAADGLYLPVEYEIISGDTLDIWCDEIDEPVHAAYAMQSFEPRVNLFAGEYPVASFYTDHSALLNIEARPWYDTSVQTVWGIKEREDALDYFLHPVWMPEPGAEVCHDTCFCRESSASVRVCADAKNFGCCVKAYKYNRLDFAKYAAMEVNFYNTNGMTAKLVLKTMDSENEFAFTKISDIGSGWSRYRADFAGLGEDEIESMSFRFAFESDRYTFVNIEKLRLIRK